MSTGGDIGFARAIAAGDGDGLLVLAGSVLQRIDGTGRVSWRNGRLGVSYVQYVGDVDGTATPCALVKADARTLVLVDVATGEICWRWIVPPGTFVGDGAGLKVEPRREGAALYLFPTYGTDAWCFDFAAGRRTPAIRWHVTDLPFDAGFGPSVVLADMDADGRRELFLSSRIGTDYRRNIRTGTTTTSEMVLGRQHGMVWQAVMDPTDGRLLRETHFEAVPGAPHDSARPYGLLHAMPLQPAGLPDVVLVSCQVEEYAVLTGRTSDGGLERRDGWFVEKDWPVDIRELRPQPSSVADLRGDGRPLLVVGLWRDDEWRTLVLDPRRGLHEPVAVLDGRYFWGCHDIDGDGRPEILTSRESRRSPRSTSTLEAWGGSDLRRIGVLRATAIVASSNSPLPLESAYMANRRNAIEVALEDGRRGVLVRRTGSAGPEVGLWGAAGGARPRFAPLAAGAFDRADASGNAIVFGDAVGRLQQIGFDGIPRGGGVQAEGRFAMPLAWATPRPEIIVDCAGHTVVGGAPDAGTDGRLDGAWTVHGMLPALDIQQSPARLVLAAETRPNRPALALHPAPIGSAVAAHVPLPAPVYLGIVPLPLASGYAVNLRTGVHTMSIEVCDGRGRLRWRDGDKGAYLRPPAADILDDVLVVLADDHGELRLYDATGAQAWLADWTAAYTMPMTGPFGPGGEWAILRGGGIHGVELLDASGATIWRIHSELWEYASSTPAIGWLTTKRIPALGAVTRAGMFHCLDVRTGALRWQLDLGCAPNATSVVAADLDGDGSDEYVVGLPDGRLICIAEDETGCGVQRWHMTFDVAVANPIVVDLDGDGAAELVVATADGAVRWLW